MLGLSGCFAEFTTERIAQNSYRVGEYEVVETIYRSDSFPDAVFERVIEVGYGRSTTRIGTYKNESSEGITISPELVDGWLAIYSSSHLFLWQPDKDVNHFMPYDVDGWQAYADEFIPFNLNGHYDYRVTRFWIENGRWLIAYECTYCQDTQPAALLFTSTDEGKTFAIEE